MNITIPGADLSDPAALKPVPLYMPDTSETGRDQAGRLGFNINALEEMVGEVDEQPEWRSEAAMDAAYIDGKQFDEEQQEALIQEGMAKTKPTNLVGRVIRGILGQEAKARTDVKVSSDNSEMDDVCDLTNEQLKKTQREAFVDLAVSQGYAGQVGPGLGWVEVARSADPLEFPIRVQDVHLSEMYWDMTCKDKVLFRDARWIDRTRWQDLDELQAKMPSHRALLHAIAGNWQGFGGPFNGVGEDLYLASQFENVRRWDSIRGRDDWYDHARKRVRTHEIWYRVPAMGVILELGPMRNVLFNPANPNHVHLLATKAVPFSRQLTSQVRCAFYAGPHRLYDVGTRRRRFPFTPFVAYTDDAMGTPYGLVAGMRGPQDEYNARRIRINWMLRARQMIMDGDALLEKANTLEQVQANRNRPDLTVILDPNRQNKTSTAFQLLQDAQLQREQIDAMESAKALVQEVPGVYGSQLGQASTGVTSGIANSLLIEQGAVSMGDLNDNYRHSRRHVYENVVDEIIEIFSKPNMKQRIGVNNATRIAVFNVWDGEQGKFVNHMPDAEVDVGLGDVPTTPAYRMQQQQNVAALIGALQGDPQAVSLLAPSFIESTDLSDRKELADDLRRMKGMPTAGDKKAAQKLQQQQAAEQAEAKALQKAMITLEMEDKAAKIEETKSKTELNNAKSVSLGYEIGDESGVTPPQPPQQGQEVDPAAERQRLIDEALLEAA